MVSEGKIVTLQILLPYNWRTAAVENKNDQ